MQVRGERDALIKDLESARVELSSMEDRWRQARATITSHVVSRDACLSEQKCVFPLCMGGVCMWIGTYMLYVCMFGLQMRMHIGSFVLAWHLNIYHVSYYALEQRAQKPFMHT
jgi:hypothetical protein